MIMSTQKNQSAMDKLNEKISKKAEELEQLKRQKRAKQMRAQKEARKEDTRRKIVIGGLVLKYFPQLSQLQPKRNNEENNAEFQLFANVLSVLASDKELVERLTAQAWDKIKASAPPADNQNVE
jgi:GTP1/Obg family GTP-binding protein